MKELLKKIDGPQKRINEMRPLPAETRFFGWITLRPLRQRMKTIQTSCGSSADAYMKHRKTIYE